MTTALFYRGPSFTQLHEHYAKRGRIDERAPVVCSVSTEVSAPAARVWQVLSDLASWPLWYPGMRILGLGEVRPDAPLRWRMGGVTFSSVFALVEPGRELTWTGRFLCYRAVDRHLVEPLPGGRTRVTIAESLAGPLLPLLYPAAKLRAGHERWLAAFRRVAEGGGPAVVNAG